MESYDRFESEKGSGGTFVMGLLAGTVLGASLGMLFAPKSGSELRGQISDRANKLANQASDGYKQATDAANDGYKRAADAASDGVRKVADAASDTYKRATSAAREGYRTATDTASGVAADMAGKTRS
jgi:gas vesicle protein